MQTQTYFVPQNTPPIKVNASTTDVIMFLAGQVISCGLVLLITNDSHIIAYHVPGFAVDDLVLQTLSEAVSGDNVERIWIFTNKIRGTECEEKYLKSAREIVRRFRTEAEYYVTNSESYSNLTVTVMPGLRLALNSNLQYDRTIHTQ